MTSSYDVYTAQVRECDAAIERQFQAIMPVWDNDLPPIDRQDKALSHRKNASAYDACSLLYQLTGMDLVAIPGLHASTGQTIIYCGDRPGPEEVSPREGVLRLAGFSPAP